MPHLNVQYTYNDDFQLTSFGYAGGDMDFEYDNDGLATRAGDFVIGRNAANGLPETISDLP